MTKVVCWNMNHKLKSWQKLVQMGADVALLQEPCGVPYDVADRVAIEPPEHWEAWDSCLRESAGPTQPHHRRPAYREAVRSREGGLVQASPAALSNIHERDRS